MKSLKHFRILPLIAGTTLLLTCIQASAAGYKLADKVGASIAEFRDEVIDVKKEVDATLASLDKIVAQATIDPRKAFKEFDKNVPDVDSAATKAKKRAMEMKEKGKKYFNEWEKELAAVNDPDIRKLAEERKAKLEASFSNIRNSMEPVRDQFNTWLASLKDLQKYLSNDLTIGGIDAAKDLIAKNKAEGLAVQQNLDKVIAELNTVVATITPAKAKK
jgi:high-affinity Fe2+/Pb2+ permease